MEIDWNEDETVDCLSESISVQYSHSWLRGIRSMYRDVESEIDTVPVDVTVENENDSIDLRNEVIEERDNHRNGFHSRPMESWSVVIRSNGVSNGTHQDLDRRQNCLRLHYEWFRSLLIHRYELEVEEGRVSLRDIRILLSEWNEMQCIDREERSLPWHRISSLWHD